MRLTLHMAAFAALTLPAFAQEAPIQSTIQSQLDAFTAQDSAKAFSYASPTIKGLFGNSNNFAMMVQNGYPMVWQHQAVKMLELRTIAGNLWQRVMITDGAGETFLLDYKMMETPEGWQIDAVQLLPKQDIGA